MTSISSRLPAVISSSSGLISPTRITDQGSRPSIDVSQVNATRQGATLASLIANKHPSSSAKETSTSQNGSISGPEAMRKVKELGKQLLAIMLIRDPVERAKSAARLYKEYGQVAKDYAAGKSSQPTNSNTDVSKPVDANSDNINDDFEANANEQGVGNQNLNHTDAVGGGVGSRLLAIGAPTLSDPISKNSPYSVTSLVVATQSDAVNVTSGNPNNSVELGSALTPTAGKRLDSDVFMDVIKTFAVAAKQVYNSASDEARRDVGNKNQLRGLENVIDEGSKTLAEAVRAVEGTPAAADRYGFSGIGSSQAESPSILELLV